MAPWTRASGMSKGAFGVLLRRKPLGALGGVLLLAMVGLAFFGGWVAPYGYDDVDVFSRLRPASGSHWLGTDNLGRDLLSRIIHGARVSMAVGFGGVALGLAGATLVGLLSGYFGGRVDILVQRVVDAFMCFPLLLVALTIMALLGPGLVNVILTLGLVLAVRDSRVIRSAVLTVKTNLYVESARALGAGHGAMIALIEAALSFLGFGVPPPHPSWGGMLSGAGLVHMLRAPWLALWPGVALSLAVFGANMLGDALRDVLDPRLRGTE